MTAQSMKYNDRDQSSRTGDTGTRTHTHTTVVLYVLRTSSRPAALRTGVYTDTGQTDDLCPLSAQTCARPRTWLSWSPHASQLEALISQ